MLEKVINSGGKNCLDQNMFFFSNFNILTNKIKQNGLFCVLLTYSKRWQNVLYLPLKKKKMTKEEVPISAAYSEYK